MLFRSTTKPGVCAGKMDPVTAAQEIAAGRLDGMGTGRQNLVDPEWINKILEGREDEIKPCINCHNACFNFNRSKGTPNLQSMDDSLHLARCALTPPTMQHNKYKLIPTKHPKKVAIIGGGVGGMECALVLKKRGHHPVIFEKSDRLGGLYNTAAAMSFKEADRKLLAWYERELKENDIEIRFNMEINDPNTIRREFDEIIACTGSVPKRLPVKGSTRPSPVRSSWTAAGIQGIGWCSSAAASPPARPPMSWCSRASTPSSWSTPTI